MTSHDDKVFVVDADGTLITAVGIGRNITTLHGTDAKKIATVTEAANLNLSVDFIYGARPLVAGWDSEEGILAALLSAAPGRSYVKQAPEGILEELHRLAGKNDDAIIY